MTNPKKLLTQASLFYNALIENDDAKELKSASDWNIDCQVAIQMYLKPVDDPSKVLPAHCMVTLEGKKACLM